MTDERAKSFLNCLGNGAGSPERAYDMDTFEEKKFKVTLINPNYRTKLGGDDSISSILPPLGIAYIAAVLRENNIDVHIIDMNAENITYLEVLANLTVHKPDLIGITCTTPTINAVNSLVDDIKSWDRDMPIVVGGPHPTSMSIEVMANPNINYVVVGEGENTMLELCRAYEGLCKLEDIDGLVYRSGHTDTIMTNNPRALIEDINKLPFPAIDLLPLDKYKSSYSKYDRFANILTSRGCPGRCIYCNKQIFGFNVRMRSASNMIEEIKMLHDKYGYKEFHIVDDLFTQDKPRVINFCWQIKANNLKIAWKLGNGVRVGSVDYELLKTMKEAGLYSISFGIESGNQQILNKMRKGQTPKMCKEAVEAARKLGLFVVGFFMLGNLGENEATMRETIEFAKSLPLDVAQFSILVPFPGTDVRVIIEKEGKILETDYSKYDNIDGKMLFEHGELTKELVERMHKLAYKEFYSRPSFILNRLVRTRSWLELKNQIKGGVAIFGIGVKK